MVRIAMCGMLLKLLHEMLLATNAIIYVILAIY